MRDHLVSLAATLRRSSKDPGGSGTQAGRRRVTKRSFADRTPRWAKAAGALFVSATMLVGVVPAGTLAAPANPAPVGGGFTVTPGDLAFILKQIKIAERHSRAFQGTEPASRPTRIRPATRTTASRWSGPAPDQIPDRLTSYGLRTVDGSCNNLVPGRENVRGGGPAVPAADDAGRSRPPSRSRRASRSALPATDELRAEERAASSTPSRA